MLLLVILPLHSKPETPAGLLHAGQIAAGGMTFAFLSAYCSRWQELAAMAVDIGYRAGTITASFNLLFALTLPLSGLTTWSSGHSSHFWINAFVSCNGQLGMVVIIYLHHRHVRKEALESWCTHALGLPAAFFVAVHSNCAQRVRILAVFACNCIVLFLIVVSLQLPP